MPPAQEMCVSCATYWPSGALHALVFLFIYFFWYIALPFYFVNLSLLLEIVIVLLWDVPESSEDKTFVFPQVLASVPKPTEAD